MAVKILFVKKKHLVEDDPKFQARECLIREVYNMRRLNVSQHPNFPVLLGYDTKSLPYHLITEFEHWGNLLQFVRSSRERDPPVQPVQLLKMLIDISDALLYLEDLGLVHRAVMAENVLVGDNFVCKLSGLQSLQQLDRGSSSEGIFSGREFSEGLMWRSCLKYKTVYWINPLRCMNFNKQNISQNMYQNNNSKAW